MHALQYPYLLGKRTFLIPALDEDCDLSHLLEMTNIVAYSMLLNTDSNVLWTGSSRSLLFLKIEPFPCRTTACLWVLVALTGSTSASRTLLLSLL